MSKKLTNNEILERFYRVHGGKYDYSVVQYNGMQDKVDIICRTHGNFSILPSNHLKGQGCSICGTRRGASLITHTRSRIIEDSVGVHGDYYDYSCVSYINNITKIDIICKEHGKFKITPKDHKSGSGCPACGKRKSELSRRLSHEEVIRDFVNKHGTRYDYSKVDYINDATKVTVICKKHGEFLIAPGSHKARHGCAKCSSGNISNAEVKWLDLLLIPHHYRQKLLNINNRRIRVDAYVPETNTIYEYYGDFWHGNPEIYNQDDINPRNKKTYGALYQETKIKKRFIISAGYNLIEIWESEFLKK